MEPKKTVISPGVVIVEPVKMDEAALSRLKEGQIKSTLAEIALQERIARIKEGVPLAMAKGHEFYVTEEMVELGIAEDCRRIAWEWENSTKLARFVGKDDYD